MKKVYEAPEIEVNLFETEDIITTSGTLGDLTSNAFSDNDVTEGLY